MRRCWYWHLIADLLLMFKDYEKKMREEARLREADDTDSHHIAVAKFMQKVVLVTSELMYSCPVLQIDVEQPQQDDKSLHPICIWQQSNCRWNLLSTVDLVKASLLREVVVIQAIEVIKVDTV